MKTTKAHKIIEEIEKESYNSGYKDGQKDGFKEGYEAFEKKVLAALKSKPEGIQEAIKFTGVGNPFRSGTASAQVYSYIKENPGRRGVEIIKALGIGTKIGRTALWRMKKDTIAVNEDGWRIL